MTLLARAIGNAGYTAGREGVAIALDPAANGLDRHDRYRVGGESLFSEDLTDRYTSIIAQFPVWSIEDGMDEYDTAGWHRPTVARGDRVQLVGDDNFVISAGLIRSAARDGIGNAALIKVSQIGTLSETIEVLGV